MSDRHATTVTYGSSVFTFLGGAFTINEWVMLFGALLGALTFIYNIWYKERMLSVLREKDNINIIEEVDK